MRDDILQIDSAPMPFDLNEKMFWVHLSDDENHDCHECDCYQESYNDWLKKLQDMSGVNQELLGPAEPQHN